MPLPSLRIDREPLSDPVELFLMIQPVITRESILNGTIRRLVEQSGDDGRLMTDQERKQIVENMIETAPSLNSMWVFGYGSLIWNPALYFTEKKRGTVHGYHRRFCLWSTIGRGSPSRPGLMLGLERGGSCKGIFYKIDRREIRTELDIVFRRELITAAYRPTWVSARILGKSPFKAIAFVINRDHNRYAGMLDDETVIQTIANAKGTLGSCSDYLYETVLQLENLGMPDRHLASIARHVRQKEHELAKR
jgi:cation transport protein ChaC